MPTDSELLRQYAQHGDQEAFAEIVRRQVAMVYSVALRVTNGDTYLAEDVTQNVFVKLARQAVALDGFPNLIGWLHATARNTAIKVIRADRRRRVRELEAFTMNEPSTSPEVNWEQIQPWLDEAVGHLDESDRHAVLLRYFQNLSHRDVGAHLGLGEDAARKRVDRAVDKLRAYFNRRGMAVSAGLLAEVLDANSVHAAPAGLAARVSGQSLGGVAVGGGFALRMFFMSTKNKTIMTVAVIFLVGVLFWWRSGFVGLSSTDAGARASAAKTTAASQSREAVILAPSVGTSATVALPSVNAASVDPHDGLATEIDDIIQRLQSGDFYAMTMEYGPPDLVAQARDLLSSNPDLKKTWEGHWAHMMSFDAAYATARVQVYQNLKGMSPTMNADGDQAVYHVTPPAGMSGDEPRGSATVLPFIQVVFRKIDGKWYLSQGPGSLLSVVPPDEHGD